MNLRVKTCLRYPGGKFYGWTKIKPLVITPHKEYRELMVGGGSVFLGKELVKKNWINDLDKNLINFYKIIQNDSCRKELYELLANDNANKAKHTILKNTIAKNKVESAYHYFYLNRTSFSGIMVNPRWGYMIGSSVEPQKWIERIEHVAKKLQNVRITSYDFRKVITAKSIYENEDILLYIDPPYYNASSGIYKNSFTKQDHLDLQKMLRNTQFKFILSYDDVEEIRELYDWAFLEKSSWKYYISENRRSEGKELIITNFKKELW